METMEHGHARMQAVTIKHAMFVIMEEISLLITLILIVEVVFFELIDIDCGTMTTYFPEGVRCTGTYTSGSFKVTSIDACRDGYTLSGACTS